MIIQVCNRNNEVCPAYCSVSRTHWHQWLGSELGFPAVSPRHGSWTAKDNIILFSFFILILFVYHRLLRFKHPQINILEQLRYLLRFLHFNIVVFPAFFANKQIKPYVDTVRVHLWPGVTDWTVFTLARTSIWELFKKDFWYSINLTKTGSLTMTLYRKAQNEFDIDIDTFVNCKWVYTRWAVVQYTFTHKQ